MKDSDGKPLKDPNQAAAASATGRLGDPQRVRGLAGRTGDRHAGALASLHVGEDDKAAHECAYQRSPYCEHWHVAALSFSTSARLTVSTRTSPHYPSRSPPVEHPGLAEIAILGLMMVMLTRV